MNFRKFLKWSLVLMAFLAYKQLDASDSPDDYKKPAYTTIVTMSNP